MKDKLFIDTNVLIDVVTNRDQPHVIYSQRLFAESEEDTRHTLKVLCNFLNVMDLSSDDVISLLDTDWSDYEDALQYKSALSANADYIVTGNIDDFANSSVEVISPKEYLEKIL